MFVWELQHSSRPRHNAHRLQRRLPAALQQRQQLVMQGFARQPHTPACSRLQRGRVQRCPSSRRHASASAAAAEAAAAAAGGSAAAQQQQQRLLAAPLQELMREAAALRDAGHRNVITFSPKVFLPLTRLCRDSCGYCTFAQPPVPGRRAFMTLDEVLAVAQLGQQQGCSEALFTLGDKPELLYREAAEELAAMGYASTLEYVAAAAAAVLEQTGMLPHINAGVMSAGDVRRLKAVSASQGLMLEGTAPALAAPGGPHWGCPDKQPAARLAVIEAAGQEGVPFTTGLLIGIGESRADRLDALAAIRRLHACYGHIQELIIQPFRAKHNTAMQGHAEPPLDELLWTVAAARVMFGCDMNIQAPPNLVAGSTEDGGGLDASWHALLDAGINDWGGISPITRDYVNPEKSWPHLAPLAEATAAAGKLLLPRLPVYPAYVLDLSSSSSSSSSIGESSSSSAGEAESSSSSRAGEAESSSSGAAESSRRGAESGSSSCYESSSSRIGDESSSRSRRHAGLRWLSCEGGPRSVAAAVLRAADSSGLLRSSSWVAGRQQQDAAAGELALAELLPAAPAAQAAASESAHSSGSGAAPQQQQQQQQQQQAPAVRPAVPLPRPRQSKAWSIAVSSLGTLQGLPSPCRVSADTQQLLDDVLQSVAAAAASQTSSSSSSSGGDGCSRGGGSRQWQQAEVELLLSARGADMQAVVAAADALRRAVCGDDVSYVVNRNINYTNVCTYGCTFCAFSKGKRAEELRGAPYLLPLEEISRRTAEAWDRGASEVCLQGGIHPDFTGDTYLAILAAAKAGAPAIHVHAFSPLEVLHGATTLGLPVGDYLARLKAAGLGSLPGTAAEVLDADVRGVLCPDKLSAEQWLEVVAAAHSVGLRTTSTIMFGHVDSQASWAAHLLQLRNLQASTGGITEFVPLPFVHMEAPLYLAGRARRGPTLRECVLMHAVARLVLHPLVTNIQASWVKMGPQHAAALLAAGCNDMGGSIMNESITRAAGAAHGQELPPVRMEELIRAAGRQPYQRTTLYGRAPQQRVAASFVAPALQPQALSSSSSSS